MGVRGGSHACSFGDAGTESLAKTGVPSRAEITDAAMGERAECVMFNKGPHLCDAVRSPRRHGRWHGQPLEEARMVICSTICGCRLRGERCVRIPIGP